MIITIIKHGVTTMATWYFNPQTGGRKIPTETRSKTCARANTYAATCPWYPKKQLKLRFKGQFCYLDTLEEEGNINPIGRLRYFDNDKWSLAFYTFSNERYEPCIFSNGEWFGTIEEAIEVCEIYMI